MGLLENNFLKESRDSVSIRTYKKEYTRFGFLSLSVLNAETQVVKKKRIHDPIT